jgi:hypothetical protein
VLGHVCGVVPRGGVPGDGEGLAGELEGDGTADRAGQPVAGPPAPKICFASSISWAASNWSS